MGGESHQVNAIFIHIHRNFSDGLCGIAEYQYAVFAGNGTDFLHRHDGANFIIGIHDGDQDRIGFDRGFQFCQVDQSVVFYFQVGHFPAFFFNMLAGIQHRFMFDIAGDDMVALAGIHFENAFDRQVIPFSSTGSKDDFFRICADQFGYLFAGIIHGFLRCPPKRVVTAGRITEIIGEIRDHSLYYTGVAGRCGIMVEINGKL